MTALNAKDTVADDRKADGQQDETTMTMADLDLEDESTIDVFRERTYIHLFYRFLAPASVSRTGSRA